MDDTAGPTTGSAHQPSSLTRFGRSDYPLASQLAANLSADGQWWYTRSLLFELGCALVAAVVSDAGAPLIDLGLKVAATVGSSLTTTVPPVVQVWLAIISGALLPAAIGAQIWRSWAALDRAWFDGRAVRESTKTLTWRYMTGVERFVDDARADQLYEDAFEQVVRSSPIVCWWLVQTPGRRSLMRRSCEVAWTDVLAMARRLIRPTGSSSVSSSILDPSVAPMMRITQEMRDMRKADWQAQCSTYVAKRLNDQIAYYDDNVQTNRTWKRRMTLAAMIAQVLAIVAVALRVWEPNWNLTGVFTTLVASCVAWAQARRFHDLILSYAVARDELKEIKARTSSSQTEDDFRVMVVDGENAISREHTMWIAKSGSSIA
jgi:hypothetical protein